MKKNNIKNEVPVDYRRNRKEEIIDLAMKVAIAVGAVAILAFVFAVFG